MLKSCFGLRLRIGGLIIGWISIVGCTTSLIFMTIDLVKAHKDGNKLFGSLLNDFIIAVGIGLLASGMLVMGIHREHHLMLLPWLICGIIVIFFLIFEALFSFDKEGFPMVLYPILILAVHCYILCVIYSLYKKIKTSRYRQLSLQNPGLGQEEISLPKNPSNEN